MRLVDAECSPIETGTDEHGDYEVGGLRPGAYLVRARADGYMPVTEPVTVDEGRTAEIDLELRAESDDAAGPESGEEGDATPGAVAGEVADAESGERLVGADVAVVDPECDDVGGATGDEDGYEPIDVAPGAYLVVARADGYELDSAAVAVDSDETVTVDLSLTAEPAPTLSLAAPDSAETDDTLRVVATMTDDGDPLENVSVALSVEGPGEADPASTTQQTDEQGRASFAYPVDGAGSYTLRASATHHGEEVVEAVTTHVSAAEPDRGAISGTVSDADTDEPIEDATVAVASTGTQTVTATTGTDGAYTVEGLVAESYTVRVTAEGYAPAAEAGVVVLDSETATVDFSLTAEAVASGSLAGEVTDGDSGDPVGGARVAVLRSGAETVTVTQTGAEGAYAVEGLVAASYTVRVTAEGYAPEAEAGVVVHVRETATVDFALSPAPSEPQPPDDGDEGDDTDDGDEGDDTDDGDDGGGGDDGDDGGGDDGGEGGNDDDGDEGGNGDDGGEGGDGDDGDGDDGAQGGGGVDGDDDDGREEVDDADDRAHEGDEVDDADRAGAVAGEVTGADGGAAVEGVEVTAVSGDSEELDALTDDNGAYEIEGLAPGTYDVTAEKDGYQPETDRGVEVEASETTTVDFALEAAGSVAGAVTDAESGEGIEGAQVTAVGGDGEEAVAATDGDGAYEIGVLGPGRHTVTARVEGYQPATTSDVMVQVGETTTVDFALEPGEPDGDGNDDEKVLDGQGREDVDGDGGGVFVTGLVPDLLAGCDGGSCPRGQNAAGAREVIQRAVGFATRELEERTAPRVLYVASGAHRGLGDGSVAGMQRAGFDHGCDAEQEPSGHGCFDVAYSSGHHDSRLSQLEREWGARPLAEAWDGEPGLEFYDAVVVGSQQHAQAHAHDWQPRHELLYDFVNGGGGVVVFAQSGRLSSVLPFLEEGVWPAIAEPAPTQEHRVTGAGSDIGLAGGAVNGVDAQRWLEGARCFEPFVTSRHQLVVAMGYHGLVPPESDDCPEPEPADPPDPEPVPQQPQEPEPQDSAGAEAGGGQPPAQVPNPAAGTAPGTAQAPSAAPAAAQAQAPAAAAGAASAPAAAPAVAAQPGVMAEREEEAQTEFAHTDPASERGDEFMASGRERHPTTPLAAALAAALFGLGLGLSLRRDRPAGQPAAAPAAVGPDEDPRTQRLRRLRGQR